MVLFNRDGSIAATALLTKHQWEFLRTVEQKIQQLQNEREELKKAGRHNSAGTGTSAQKVRGIETVSSELAAISTELAKLKNQLDMQADALDHDLDFILGSNILLPWITTRIPTLNQIAEKLAKINQLNKFGPSYRGERIISTKDRHKPARYWLNENYAKKGKYGKSISLLSPDYILIGIKGNWTRRDAKGSKETMSKRDTLRKALEYERENKVKFIPRTEGEAITLKEIDRLMRTGRSGQLLEEEQVDHELTAEQRKPQAELDSEFWNYVVPFRRGLREIQQLHMQAANKYHSEYSKALEQRGVSLDELLAKYEKKENVETEEQG